MRMAQVFPEKDHVLRIVDDNGRSGFFDVKPYLGSEAFSPLKNYEEFSRIYNGGYFIEWECGADLCADTIEARWTQPL